MEKLILYGNAPALSNIVKHMLFDTVEVMCCPEKGIRIPLVHVAGEVIVETIHQRNNSLLFRDFETPTQSG